MGRDHESTLFGGQTVPGCAAVHPLLPAAALGALEPGEGAEVAVHLRRCRDCRREYDDYRNAAESLAFAVPSRRPPAALRERFLAAMRSSGRSITLIGRSALAVAAVLALLLLTSNAVLWFRLNDARAELAAIDARRRNAATLPLVWYDLAAVDTASGGAQGTLCAQDGGDVAWLITQELPALPAGQVYQAWLWTGSERVSAGTFRVDERGRGFLTIRLSRPITAFIGLGVSAEPAGGSPTPSDTNVLYGSI